LIEVYLLNVKFILLVNISEKTRKSLIDSKVMKIKSETPHRLEVPLEKEKVY
jgi:hypothetical protein